jgi:glycosyltransferase involved in cell wall biosynthesis
MSEQFAINFSAVVVCYNEAQWIQQCLGSLDFCQEIIVVDMGSTDESVELAHKLGARVLHHEHLYAPNLPRQYGIANASNEWVFTIDMDEIFPKEEVYKIVHVIQTHPDLHAIRVPIQYYFRRKKLNCTLWAKPGITRWTVLHRDRAKGTPLVHEEFRRDQKIYYLSWDEMTPIKHYWRDSYQELFAKMWVPLNLEGEAQYTKGKRFSWYGMLKATAIELKANLINFRGLYGGVDGITLSFAKAWYELMTWVMLRRYERHFSAVARDSHLVSKV